MLGVADVLRSFCSCIYGLLCDTIIGFPLLDPIVGFPFVDYNIWQLDKTTIFGLGMRHWRCIMLTVKWLRRIKLCDFAFIGCI